MPKTLRIRTTVQPGGRAAIALVEGRNQIRIGGVDFPELLLNTLRDRRLVVFAGTSVSMEPILNEP